jgi:ankyrin repeat protein
MKIVAVLMYLGWAGAAAAQNTTNVTTPSNPNPLDPVLEDACLKGDLRQMVEMIDQGASPNAAAGTNRITPLIVASSHSLELTRLLLAKGAKVDTTDAPGNTPLNYACAAGQTDCATALLEAGANVNLANKDGRTPLINAVRADDTDLVKTLLAHHADVNANASPIPALVWAINNKEDDILRLLVDAGADVNLVPPAPDEQEPGFPPLHAAAATGDLTGMDLLLAHHADVNLHNHWDVTPLMSAAFRDQIIAMQELLDRGAKVDVQSNDGKMSALLIGCYAGYYDVVEALINNHANLELKNKDGETALILTARHMHSGVVKLLVDNGADVNATDAIGETALAYAGSRGDTTLADWLADHGAARTDLHILAWPAVQPPLPAARAWAVAVSAVYAVMSGVDPNRLGYDDHPNIDLTQSLRQRWQITDRASLLAVLDDLQNHGPRPDWRAKGIKLAALSDDQFKTFLFVNTAVLGTSLDNFEAQAIRKSYLKWKDRIGLAWALCVSANLINRGYTLHYLDEKEAWDLLLANARVVQANFGSWREMSDNFLDGREISDKARDTTFEACSQLLVHPKDPNSPWNKLPWKTDLIRN